MKIRPLAVAMTAAVCLAAGYGVMRSVRLEAGQTQGVTYKSPTGTTLRLMLDETNVGGEVTLGEMIFPPNSDSGEHQHAVLEMFYVVSGEYEHIVNGKSEVLKPGMATYVKPPDKVRHKTGPAGAKVVVVWIPGEEGKRIASRWKREP